MPARVDEARLLAADDPANAGQWLTHGRDYSEQRFSPLARITVDNVSRLGLAWFADFDTRRGQESTPLVIDGVIYVTTAWSKVYAYDARSGALRWQFDPHVPRQWAVNACCDVPNRGVAAWNGRLYLGTIDGRLIAIDAATGRSVWDVSTIEPGHPYAITGAPRVARGKVLIGQGGSEFAQRGYISAYDAGTGALDWRWYIVPGNPADGFENAQMALAAKTWRGEWWKKGGGGTPWDAITYDPQTGLVYVGTGNGAPWPSEIRSPGGGDNLFLSSIVALKIDTGEYVWHYQATPQDSWDYDNTQQITVADLTIDGRRRHVLMQAPKNGFFYVLDAATGELISAKAYVADVNWATGIDMKTGRPILSPAANYSRTGKGAFVLPYFFGAHSWHPMSYSPQTGLVYLSAMHHASPFVAVHQDDNVMGQQLSVSFAKGEALLRSAAVSLPDDTYLLAWDPVGQREAWRVPYPGGVRGGGTLATAGGLVFSGSSGNELAAYRADTGARLWRTDTQTGAMAGPVAFALDGEQYIAVVAGYRQGGTFYTPNDSRLLVFKLDGRAQLPAPVPVPAPVLNPPPSFGISTTTARGAALYDRYCSTCHGAGSVSRPIFPDLRYSPAIDTADAFRAIVIDGARAANGMVSFARALTADDAEAVRAYVVAQANAAKRP